MSGSFQRRVQMSHLAGFVFDIYDDPTGEILRDAIPSREDVPDFIKEAALIDEDTCGILPDDAYALVMIKNGHKFRKYATVDRGNTALSVLYLVKRAHLLPNRVVKVAANNLIEACHRHGLDIPQELKLAAEMSAASTAPEPPLDSKENPQLGQGDEKDEDTKDRTNIAGVQGTNYLDVPAFSPKERATEGEGVVEKVAAADPRTRALFDKGADAETREKNWRISPYVDVEDWEPGSGVVKQASAPERTLLRGKYPIDSYDQVKTAAVYFSEGLRMFHPRDRREYCVKLAARMQELCIDVPELIEKYASEGYGADVEAYVGYRRGFVEEEFHPALSTLLEKRAQVSPDTFAEALCEFDNMTNLNYLWDSQITDPWASTYGPSFDKLAADAWVWDHNGVRVDEGDLKNLATNGLKLIQDKFGGKFAAEFAKSPKTFFNALPLPNRIVVGRLAMDRHAGTVTE
jgi:hypothetical protein